MNGQFDLGAIDPVRYFVLIAAGLGLLFGLITEQTAGISFWQHLLLWQFQALTPMALMIISHVALSNWQLFTGLNPWVQLLFSGSAGILVFTPIALLMDRWALEETSIASSYIANLIEEFVNVAPPIVFTWLVINAPWIYGFRVQRLPIDDSSENNEISEESAEQSDFLEKNCPDLQGDLVYLKAELHYLQVVTTAGSSLILFNLRDAIAQIPVDLGIQCHRSYWVNRNYIASIKKKGREGEVELENGTRIPVSRSRLSTVLAS